jgi:membrane fusion protein (multidrug efflux system)
MRIVIAVALATLLLGAGCGVQESRADGQVPDQIAKVELTTVVEKPVGTYVVVTGQLVANQRAQVASDGTGRVVATLVERGQAVAAGDPLVKLDPRSATLSFADARATVEALRSNAERARRDCARADDLFQQNTISQSDYDRLKFDCKTTEANATGAIARQELASKAVGDAVVRAPFSGVVDERSVNVGEYVRAGTPVATLVEIDPIRIQVTVPESQVGAIREGQTVDFEVPAYPGVGFAATVKYLSGAMREKSRDLVVEAITPNKDRKLRPGMFVNARIRVGEQPMPVVPQTALRMDGTLARLYVVVNGRLEERLVQLGRRDGGEVAIESGAKKGDKIVAKITAEVRDGLKVE